MLRRTTEVSGGSWIWWWLCGSIAGFAVVFGVDDGSGGGLELTTVVVWIGVVMIVDACGMKKKKKIWVWV